MRSCLHRCIAWLSETNLPRLDAKTQGSVEWCGDLARRPGTIDGVIVPSPFRPRHRGGPLRPVELAPALVMGALCAAGRGLLGTVPPGLLAYRYRLRVLMAATVAAGVIAFLIAGLGGFMTVVHCVYIGGLTGVIKRRGRGTPTVIVSYLIAGIAFGAVHVGALA